MLRKLKASDSNIVAIWGSNVKGTNDITSIWLQVNKVVPNSSREYYLKLGPAYPKLGNVSVDTKAPKKDTFFKIC